MLSRDDKKIIKFLRDMQGSSKYKNNDKLGKQAIQKQIQARQGYKIK